MPATPVDPSQLVSRNGPCPCGSGRRYKDCHGRLAGVDPRLRNAAILNDRGTVLQSRRHHEEALVCYDEALALLPDHPDVLGNRGNALLDLRRYEEAAQCFARLVDVAPDHRWALGSLYQARMLCCDWSSIDVLAERIRTSVREGKAAVTPFTHLVASDSPADQLHSARIEAALYHAPALAPAPKRSDAPRRRIRVAYVSADLRQHPTSTLSAHLFESHDRERFEVTAISFGPDTGDPMRRRLERAFDHFLDVRARDDAAIASLMRERGIDIAVDLMGYTNNARPGILARRPAPIQVAYLGYPGTMGGNWIDYVLADPHAIPPGEDAHYAEHVVRLPDTYFAHDPLQRIGDAPTRIDAGLPDGAVVFCCFNNTYKIAPATFDVWMRILARVDAAVLWLLAPNDVARRNLCREAAARGIDPARLVFAARIPSEQHLARHRLADLFLDTHHYNAHTTAVDALWAGLPVLTFPGTTMAARVASGLLRAAGVPELVARDRADYEARAVELGRTPEALRALREKLERQRASAPLFDATRHRKAVEAAYGAMWARHAAGLAPAALDVATDGGVTARELNPH
jgi:predicted O-linked N-acetylglucosamine transferase (SPINDLY family)